MFNGESHRYHDNNIVSYKSDLISLQL